MGSFFEVRIPAGTPGGTDLACRALDRIDELEDATHGLSRRLRGQPPERDGPPRPGRRSSRACSTCWSGPTPSAGDTAGAYDVTAGALSAAWGFIGARSECPTPRRLADARARTGRHHLTLDPERRTVAVRSRPAW